MACTPSGAGAAERHIEGVRAGGRHNERGTEQDMLECAAPRCLMAKGRGQQGYWALTNTGAGTSTYRAPPSCARTAAQCPVSHELRKQDCSERAATREEGCESVYVGDAERMWREVAGTPSGRGAAGSDPKTVRSRDKPDETENAQASGAASRRGARESRHINPIPRPPAETWTQNRPDETLRAGLDLAQHPAHILAHTTRHVKALQRESTLDAARRALEHVRDAEFRRRELGYHELATREKPVNEMVVGRKQGSV
ncbi:hypothetical protein FB451DRAFT_1365635 [Mycena latifolia]|nr:hypothetical protein FB451DRAFT_1365635 [Mycena latifolia]